MIKNKDTKKKKKGFTLIELIIVLAIMAIIAAIAIPNFTSIRDNAKVKADAQSVETIKRTALMLVADGTIKSDKHDTTDKKLTFTSGSAFTPTKNAEGKVTDIAGTGVTFAGTEDWTLEEKTAISEALKEVKAPQSSGKTNFVITIDKSGNVLVE